ncbi:MAG: tRNA lysidine(34) synthetase TilS [Candidatus Saccharimonadales bacterium]
MKYVVAVSGGIDSVVMLDVLVSSTEDEFVIAHYDHGIREDSSEDAELVRSLAKTYGLVFETYEDKLGPSTSEADAREARYRWLESVMETHGADAIATAHHQDDVIETMIINLIRGTGWRGLISLGNREKLIRPLLSWPKIQIATYAIEHNLVWHDDSTNDDMSFLRNYIRYRYVQRLTVSERARWIAIHAATEIVGEVIDTELRALHRHGSSYSRYELIMSGREVTGELLTYAYGRMEKTTIDQLWHFVCTGKHGKSFRQGGLEYRLTTRELIVSPLYS